MRIGEHYGTPERVTKPFSGGQVVKNSPGWAQSPLQSRGFSARKRRAARRRLSCWHPIVASFSGRPGFLAALRCQAGPVSVLRLRPDYQAGLRSPAARRTPMTLHPPTRRDGRRGWPQSCASCSPVSCPIGCPMSPVLADALTFVSDVSKASVQRAAIASSTRRCLSAQGEGVQGSRADDRCRDAHDYQDREEAHPGD